EYNSPSGSLNVSSSSSSGGGHKGSVDALGSGAMDFSASQLNIGEAAGGGAWASGFSPGHGTSIGGGGMSSIGPAAFVNSSSTPQCGTRGIIEYLIRIVLNTLETQVHICKERTDDDVFDSPSLFVPRLREASCISGEQKPARDVEATIQEDDDEVLVMPGITISQDTISDQSHVSSDKEGPESTDLCPTGLPDPGALAEARSFPHYAKKDHDTEVVGGLLFASPIMRKKCRRQQQHIRDEPQETSIDHDSTETKESSEVPFSLKVASTGYKHSKPGAVSQEEKAIAPPTVVETCAERKGPFEIQKVTVASVDQRHQDAKTTDFGGLASRLHFGKTPPSTESIIDMTVPSPILNGGNSKLSVAPPRDRPPLNRSPEVDDEGSGGGAGGGNESLKAQTSSSLDDSTGAHKTPRSGVGGARRVSSARTRSPHRGCTNFEVTSNMTSALATAAINTERCPWCQAVLETHDEATIGLGLICLATFVHREPSLAAPFLIDMLMVASRIATSTIYTWQRVLPNVIVSGNTASIARQFLRCTVYNLAPNGLFIQLFQTPIPDPILFRAIISVLVNFEEHMSPFFPLISALDNFNKRKTLPSETLNVVLENMATYLEYLPRLTDEQKWNNFISTGWAELMPIVETFFRKLAQLRPLPASLASTLRSMICILRAPTSSTTKQGVTDAYSSILRLVIEQCHVDSSLLIEICSLCNRTFKERVKSQLTKVIVESLVSALKFRIYLPDENLLKTLQLVVMDAGGTLEPNQISPGLTNLFNPQTFHLFSTGAAELMRPHIVDCLNILSDVHMIRKVKQAQKTAVQPLQSGNPNDAGGGVGPGNTWNSTGGISGGGVQNPAFAGSASCPPAASANAPSLHEDTIGAHLKSGLAQYVALELSRHSNVKDEDVLHILAPGLIVSEAAPEVLDVPQKKGGKQTSTQQQQQLQQVPGTALKSTGSLSVGGSFRSGGQSSGGGSFSGSRQFGRGSTSIIFGGGDGPSSDMGSVYSGPKISTSGGAGTTSAGGHMSLTVPNLSSRSPSIASVLAAPGGVGQQSIMSIGHFALVPTLSHTTRLDAPILQFLP
uniref:Protein kinase domain-containing protein n=1 Tax=Mesocestoides corti TaxID=53468 RepID=A0A5K3EWM3_MESCO